MFVDLSCYLTHKCDVYRPELGVYGQTDPTSPTSVGVQCFAYYGPTLEKSIAMQGSPEVFFEATHKWFVLMYPDASLEEGDLVKNITDRFCNVVFEGGRVSSLGRYNHWEEGPVLIRALISEE